MVTVTSDAHDGVKIGRMDWKSRRIRSILELALVEDRAAEDVTTALTVEPTLRATGTILAKQACTLAGLHGEAWAFSGSTCAFCQLQLRFRCLSLAGVAVEARILFLQADLQGIQGR